MAIVDEKLRPAPQTNLMIYSLIGVGVLTFAAGLALDASRLWRAYLINNLLFLGLGIGGAVFLVVHYLAGSGWFVVVRRLPEGLVSTLKFSVVTTLLLLLGLGKLYPWTDHAMMESDHFLHHKMGYFGFGFFSVRLLFFFAVVLFFTMKLLKNSVEQDSAGGGIEVRNRQKVLSASFLVLFAPLFTVFSVDVIKSLEPKWFSTIFGVYVFSGFMQTAVAVSIISLFLLKRSGYLGLVRVDHVHDLSKYLFGWSVFWAYIGFSQFMLIWYANLPEENFYYHGRMQGSWMYVGIALLLTKFVLPFALLLPRAAKRNLSYVSAVACLVVFSEWLDLNWMIMPSYSPKGFILGWQDLGMFLGFLGIFAFSARRFWQKNSLVPQQDPFIEESKHHHVIFA